MAAAGHDVSWVVQNDHDETIDGVSVLALPRTTSRLWRWLVTNWQAFRRAQSTKSQVYHFHDPEFIPFAILLRLLGGKVIYDIHEDYVSSVSQKPYIPKLLQWPISRLAGFAELLFTSGFTRVIAERYYAERFPSATMVLNYPRLQEAEEGCRRSTTNLIYTGNVHPYRGAHIHAKIPGYVSGTTVSFIGRCKKPLHEQIQAECGGHLEQLSFVGVGENVPFTEIARQYREGEWLAGLAIFPPNEHLEKKELTKFFEYMQFGIPIIASNFPTWKRLVEDNGCGICVNPEDEREIADAVCRLREDEALWKDFSFNGIRTVREKFSWQSQEDAMLKLYDELLDR